MMCEQVNETAVTGLSTGLRLRFCRKDELDIWKRMPFDDAREAEKHNEFMTDYFERVYAPKDELFFNTCLFVCNAEDQPIATGFIWKTYDTFNSVHWLKVVKSQEGRGIGRALLSIILGQLDPADFPVYLHTQPSSYRAIKLYSDFGFRLLTDPVIGTRTNDVEECLPLLAESMTKDSFERLKTSRAPASFLKALAKEREPEF